MNPVDHALSPNVPHSESIEPTYSGVLSLFRRQYRKDPSGADIAISGVPYDLSVTNRPGTRFGPRAIREASTNLAWDGAAWPWGFDPFDSLTVLDSGDIYFDHGYPEQILDTVYKETKALLEKVPFLISLGGDHSVSYPLIKAHADLHGPLAIVQVDAHSDTWQEDEKRIDHGTMFYHAIQEGLIDSSRSVQVGIRSMNSSTHGCTVLDANWVHESGIEAAAQRIREVTAGAKVYLTFDIDGLDPAFAPGTGTPVCGGLSTWQAQTLIRKLADLDIVGMDLVEVSPAYDHAQITALAAASLLLDFICLRKFRLDNLQRG